MSGELARYSAARDWSMACHKARTSIRVITLDTSVARRRAFTQMARGIKLYWAFYPAHTSLTEPLRYRERAAVRRSGRPLSPAEIGCYTSHFKLWEWLSTSDFDQAIIFEDDVIVEWATIDNLAVIGFSDLGVHLLRLHTYSPFRCNVIKYKFFTDNNHLVRIIGMVPGGISFIKSRGANACLELHRYDCAVGLDTNTILGTSCSKLLHVSISRITPEWRVNYWRRTLMLSRSALYDRLVRIGWRRTRLH